MLKTVEAVLEDDGRLRLLEAIDPPKGARIFALIVEADDLGEKEDTQDVPRFSIGSLSESVLARDWLRPEEDEAWKHLDDL
jgi:hypothetical protein